MNGRTSAGSAGQSAVLMALCLFTMVVFLALATNAGILVNDRFRMQNTADLTAYSGAFEQARSMNQMAEMNQDMYNYVQQVRGVLNYGPSYMEIGAPDASAVYYWRQPACSCLDYSPAAQAYIKKSQAALDAQAAAVVVINRKAMTSSKAAARFTAAANFLGPHISERHLDFFDSLSSSPTSGAALVDLNRVNDTMVGYNYLRSCKCCDGCCLYPSTHSEPINSWYFKDPDQGLIYFPAMVKGVPLKNFVDFNNTAESLFGADADSGTGASDMLYGYAAAKPFEGNIGTANPDNGTGDEVPQNPVYPPSNTYEDYFRATYRARVSGIHEEMGTEEKSNSMADLIRADTSEPQFQKKVDYFSH